MMFQKRFWFLILVMGFMALEVIPALKLTDQGLVDEISEEGEVLWSLNTPAGVGTGRVTWMADLYGELVID